MCITKQANGGLPPQQDLERVRASGRARVRLVRREVNSERERRPLQSVDQEPGCLTPEMMGVLVLLAEATGCLALRKLELVKVTVQGWGCQA